MRMLVIAALVVCTLPLHSGEDAQNPAPPANEATEASLSMEDLEKLVARMALFPDPLVAQMLPASTYPIEIVQAARFAKEKESLLKSNPQEFQKEIDKQKWEETVKVVAMCPDALKMMNDDLDWTTLLGEAFIAQQEDVMQAIQNMRAKAKANGALADNKQQTVLSDAEAIRIVPTDPEVIYVPQYNPQVVYVQQPAPVVVQQPAATTVVVEDDDDELKAVATGVLAFGAGMAMGAWLSNDCSWGHGGGCYNHGYPHYGYSQTAHVNNNININNTNNFNKNTVNNKVNNLDTNKLNQKYGSYNGQKVTSARNPAAQKTGSGNWQHKAEHRGGQGYKNKDAAAKARSTSATGASRSRINDSSATGRSAQSKRPESQSRPSASPSSRPTTPDRSASPSSSNRAPKSENAFSGMERGSATRQESTRGNQSLSESRPSSASRPSPSSGGASRSGGGSRGSGGGGGGRGGGGGGRR